MRAEVGGQHQDRSTECRARDDDAVIDPDDSAHDVRHHQADETHRAGDGDSGAREN